MSHTGVSKRKAVGPSHASEKPSVNFVAKGSTSVQNSSGVISVPDYDEMSGMNIVPVTL
jgi:hypothetical protein